MEVLHILRSEPDEDTRTLIDAISGSGAKTLALYESGIDWDQVVDMVVSHEKIICWW
jgi:hypothetical protein